MADLSVLKALVGIDENDTSQDAVLNVYFDIATEKVLNRLYPFTRERSEATVVPSRYRLITYEIAAYLWNKRGAEGETAHNENGINRSYESADVPYSLLSHITPYVSVIGTSNSTNSTIEEG